MPGSARRWRTQLQAAARRSAAAEVGLNSRDPKLTVLMFNECINRADVEGLSVLMTEDHVFIDRENRVVNGRERMTDGWREFFCRFPDYRNTFDSMSSRGDRVVILGYAVWEEGGEPDHVIWTATIRDDLVAEWRIYEDNEETRRVLRPRRM